MVSRAAFLIVLALAGCATPEPRTVYVPRDVKVPVPVAVEPDQLLLTPAYSGPRPEFISPSDPAAAAALDRQNLNNLKLMVHALATRLREWRAWAGVAE